MAVYELPNAGRAGNSWIYEDDEQSDRVNIIKIDDGESDNTFEPGDSVTATFAGSGVNPDTTETMTYVGTYTHTDGTVYPVFQSGTDHYVLGLPNYPDGHPHPAPMKIVGSIDTDNTSTDKSGVFTVCFYPGTLIATPSGERRVEDLALGDRVLIEDDGAVQATWFGRMARKLRRRLGFGHAVPVKWLGRQTVSTLFGPAERLMLVRFAAGSLGGGGQAPSAA